MIEKCYRDIQSRGQLAGLSLIEVFILLGVPILLFPIFTLLKLSFGFILIIDVLLYVLFKLAAQSSQFDYGLMSFIYSRFIWPRQLSAYGLDDKIYLKDDEEKLLHLWEDHNLNSNGDNHRARSLSATR